MTGDETPSVGPMLKDTGMRGALRLWAPVAVYMALIFYASSLSQPPAPPGGDKPWHLLAYLGLGVLAARAVAGGIPAPLGLRGAAAAIAIAAAYAVTDEFHQMFVPGRSAELSDLIADVAGVCIGTSICWAWGRLVKAPGTPHTAHGTRAGTTRITKVTSTQRGV